MTTVRVPCGACVMKQSEKNFKEKPCDCCGKFFKPTYPGEKYCSEECRTAKQEELRKENYLKKYDKQKRKVEEYNRTHHFCKVCGEPLIDGRQNAHFECMLGKWREGDRSDTIKRFFVNKGYTLKEIKELVKQLREE